MKLKVGKKQYTLKYGIRAFILFERIADKPFSIEGMTDWVLFAYAMLLAGSPDADITLDEFVDAIGPDDLNTVVSWATKSMAVDKQFNGDKSEEEEVKKK